MDNKTIIIREKTACEGITVGEIMFYIRPTKLLFIDNYRLRVGDKVICRHHNYTWYCTVIDYGSDPDTYVLRDDKDGTEKCYGIDKLTKI